MELQPKGRLPVVRTGQLTGSLERIGNEIVVRCDSEEHPEFWIEARFKIGELMKELLSEE